MKEWMWYCNNFGTECLGVKDNDGEFQSRYSFQGWSLLSVTTLEWEYPALAYWRLSAQQKTIAWTDALSQAASTHTLLRLWRLNKGTIEQEQVDESEPWIPGAIHYIPHHAVICQDKQTTNLCVVYSDCICEGKQIITEQLPLCWTKVLPEHHDHYYTNSEIPIT